MLKVVNKYKFQQTVTVVLSNQVVSNIMFKRVTKTYENKLFSSFPLRHATAIFL